MENNQIIKYSVIALLLTGWISCGKQNVAVLPPEKPEETLPVTPEEPDQTVPEPEPDDGIKIENLQTRLRILDPGPGNGREYMWKSDLKDPVSGKNMWRWDPKNVIIHFPPLPEHYRVDTYFGYADADGRTILCEVVNFPEAALQWEKDYFSAGYGTLTEINVQMNGIVRLYTDSTGEKYGTLELTSLEPSEKEANLQLSVYTEIYPHRGETQVNFIDSETMEITRMYNGEVVELESGRFKYEIIRDKYILRLTSIGGTVPGELYFRVISDSKFDMDYIHPITAENGPPIMTFEKENISDK
jgi:hypothetical protein